MRVSVLASGSGGNSVYVESAGVAILLDAGISMPELGRRLVDVGRNLTRVAAVFITHDHGDHVGSSVALARKLGVPLYASTGTHSVLKRLPTSLRHDVVSGEPVFIGPFVVRPFATPHDGIESLGYRVEAGGAAMGLATDLGYLSRSVVSALQGVQLLVAEHNHDEDMLQNGPYPMHLKRRIAGGRGHLTNKQGAELVAQVLHDGLTQVVLAHLSKTNNTPERALAAFERRLGTAHGALRVHVALQDRVSPLFELPEGVTDDRAVFTA